MSTVAGRTRSGAVARPVRLAVGLALGGLAIVPGSADAAVTSTAGGGYLSIDGDGAADVITVTCVAGSVKVNGADPGPAFPGGPVACGSIDRMVGNSGAGDDLVDLTGMSQAAGFTNPALDSASASAYGDCGRCFSLGPGDDQLIDGPLGAEDFGGEGGADIMRGGGGTDRLDSGGGADVLRGEDGKDVLNAGGGNADDRLFGGDGRDNLNGYEGDDEIFGGGGGDLLYGYEGDDNLIGGAGRDRAHGDQGNDRCRAERRFTCER